MGYANADLIRLCEKARRRGWGEVDALGKLVEKSQAQCPHPSADRKIRVMMVSTRKYKKGGQHEYCLRCSKILHYTPPAERPRL